MGVGTNFIKNVVNAMDNDIQNYRQPLVTSIGIILGFVLGFTGKWATEPSSTFDISDSIILIGLIISILLLIIALFRILNNAEIDDKGKYYNVTLKMFIAGVCCSFIGVFISILQSIFS